MPVYFAQDTDSQLIKIGRVKNFEDVEARINALQLGSPVKLNILTVLNCNPHYETKLHQKFAHLRVHGEWFRPTLELVEFIGQIKRTGEVDLERTEFVAWIERELTRLGWSHRELARRAGVSGGMVSAVVAGNKQAGWDFCAAIARPLGTSPEKVFALAGLLPTSPDKNEVLKELTEVINQLPEAEQREVLKYARYRLINI